VLQLSKPHALCALVLLAGLTVASAFRHDSLLSRLRTIRAARLTKQESVFPGEVRTRVFDECDGTTRVGCKANKVKPSYNGCGPEGKGALGKPLAALAHLLGDGRMTPCCNQHDLCYDHCTVEKATCDANLNTCMRAICDELYPESAPRPLLLQIGPDDQPVMQPDQICRQQAASYYSLVQSSIGDCAFGSAQNNVCDCTDYSSSGSSEASSGAATAAATGAGSESAGAATGAGSESAGAATGAGSESAGAAADSSGAASAPDDGGAGGAPTEDAGAPTEDAAAPKTETEGADAAAAESADQSA